LAILGPSGAKMPLNIPADRLLPSMWRALPAARKRAWDWGAQGTDRDTRTLHEGPGLPANCSPNPAGETSLEQECTAPQPAEYREERRAGQVGVFQASLPRAAQESTRPNLMRERGSALRRGRRDPSGHRDRTLCAERERTADQIALKSWAGFFRRRGDSLRMLSGDNFGPRQRRPVSMTRLPRGWGHLFNGRLMNSGTVLVFGMPVLLFGARGVARRWARGFENRNHIIWDRRVHIEGPGPAEPFGATARIGASYGGHQGKMV